MLNIRFLWYKGGTREQNIHSFCYQCKNDRSGKQTKGSKVQQLGISEHREGALLIALGSHFDEVKDAVHTGSRFDEVTGAEHTLLGGTREHSFRY